MSYSYFISLDAEEDVYDAYIWYERQRKGLGDAFLLSLEAGISLIRRKPELPPLKFKNIQQVPLKRFPYCIIYKLEEEIIYVIGVFHMSRDPKAWKKRLLS